MILATQKSKNYPKVKTYKDYKKAIKLNKFDLVVVSTPTNTHYKISKYILSKKINLLVEKPLCNSLKEHNELNKIAKKNNVNIFVDYPFVHSGSINFVNIFPMIFVNIFKLCQSDT